MSMPYSIIACDKCKKRWTSRVSWGLFCYRLPDKRQHWIDRNTNWCHDCRGFEPIEEIPSLESLQAAADAAQQDYEEARAAIPNTLGARLVPWRFGEQKDQRRRNKAALKEALQALGWRQKRLSPPRCLTCGSTNVENLLHYSSEPNQPEPDRHHPGCGGLLSSQMSSSRVSMDTPSRYYDSEGAFLEQRPYRSRRYAWQGR